MKEALFWQFTVGDGKTTALHTTAQSTQWDYTVQEMDFCLLWNKENPTPPLGTGDWSADVMFVLFF